MANVRRVYTDGLRNEVPLTDGQKEQAKAYAVLLGMPEERIAFTNDYNTGYWPGDWDTLIIGTDVLPLKRRDRKPNNNISLKGAIAHEVVGHREANIGGFEQSDDFLEEAQASIRGARFAPDLSWQERMDLLRDGIHRLNSRGFSIRDVKNALRINER